MIKIVPENSISVNLNEELNLNTSLSPKESLNFNASIGIKGDKGDDGYTPIKGVDYFTEEDIESLKEIFVVKNPTNKQAICGTFTVGELTVGEGLGSTSKGTTKWVDYVTPVNAANMNSIENRLNEYMEKLQEHQSILDELSYVDLVISLSSKTPTVQEKGTTLYEVTFTWTYNKDIVSQSFNGEILGKELRAFTYQTPFNTNKTFTLSASDSKKSFSKSISFSFLNGRYWGVSHETNYDSNFIMSLSKELSSSRSKTFTVNCGEGQHIYYCIPTSFGTPTFTVGGFSGGFSKVQTIQFTNSNGHTESYDIWKSTNSNLGSTTVTVS